MQILYRFIIRSRAAVMLTNHLLYPFMEKPVQCTVFIIQYLPSTQKKAALSN